MITELIQIVTVPHFNISYQLLLCNHFFPLVIITQHLMHKSYRQPGVHALDGFQFENISCFLTASGSLLLNIICKKLLIKQRKQRAHV